MKLFGKEVTASRLLDEVQARLEARGLVSKSGEPASTRSAAPVDPMAFLVEAMSANADAAQGLPLETHRGGWAGALVVQGKSLLRTVAQGFVNEVLARQTRFNGYARDGYAQLAADVVQLRARLTALETTARGEHSTRTPAVTRAATITPPTPPDVWRPTARQSPPTRVPPEFGLARPSPSAPPPRPAQTPPVTFEARPTPPGTPELRPAATTQRPRRAATKNPATRSKRRKEAKP
jgi:hypothetical protein